MKNKTLHAIGFAFAATAFFLASVVNFLAGRALAGYGFAGVAALYVLVAFQARRHKDVYRQAGTDGRGDH